MKLRLIFGAIAGAALSLYLAADQDSQPDTSAKTGDGKMQYCLQTGDQKICTPDFSRFAKLLPPLRKDSARSRPRSEGKTETYEMGGKKFSVSPEVQRAFRNAEEEYNIPYNAMVALCGRESDCIPDSMNPATGACGLFQFMTNNVGTLYEVVYKHAETYGYKEAAALVKRTVRERDNQGNPYFDYRPVSAKAKAKLIELCHDPEFNTAMWVAYQKPNIDKYNAWLGNRTITAGELVAMNNLGLRGMQLFAKQAWDNAASGKSMKAVDFFKKHENIFGKGMAANRTLIRHPNGNYKTVRESYNDIFRFGGYGELSPAAEQAALTQ